MKRIRSPLAALLALTLLCSLCSVSASAAVKRKTAATPVQYQTYTFLGDSIAAGYGIKQDDTGKYVRPVWEVVPGTYPELVAKGVRASTTHVQAYCGFRTDEALRLLDPEYEAAMSESDRALSDRMLAGACELSQESLHEHQALAADQIRQSDLITIELGSNDCMTASAFRFSQYRSEHPENLSDKITEFRKTLDQYGEKGEELDMLIKNSQSLFNMSVFSLPGFFQFMDNWDVLIRTIRKLNPTAKIVVVGMYNPYRNWTVTEKNKIPVGHAIDGAVDLVSFYMSTLSKERSQYDFVDIRTVDVKTLPPAKDPGFLQALFIDIHPTLQGHQYIAEQILKDLRKEG